MKKIVVTGSSGYLGKPLVRALISRGYSVHGIDLFPSEINSESYKEWIGDVRDNKLMQEVLSQAQIVIHNAASVPLSMQKNTETDNNETMLRSVLENVDRKYLTKVVLISSSSVYGVPSSLPINEDSDLNPFDNYGKSKLRCEEISREEKFEELDITIVRPRTILGRDRLGLMSVLFDLVQLGLPVPVLNGGLNKYQLIHVDDLVDAVILASESPGGRIYNLGSTNFGTMKSLLEALIELSGSKSRLFSINKKCFYVVMNSLRIIRVIPFAKYQLKMYGEEVWFDTSKAQNELQWKPIHSDQSTLTESYNEYIRSNFDFSLNYSAHNRPMSSKVVNLVMVFAKRFLK